jgi:hypothetical protein
VPLRRRRPLARLLALTLGSVDLLLLRMAPRSAYALWVLLNEKGKALFCSMNGKDEALSHCAISHWTSASGVIERPHWSPGSTSSDSFQREPPTAHHTVALDDPFRVHTARRREAAADPDVRRKRREEMLIAANAGERDALRVHHKQACAGEQCRPDGELKSGSRTR